MSSRFGFPSDYTTIDLETSGLDPASDMILAIGYTQVRDNVPVKTVEVILDWTRQPDLDQEWLRRRLTDTESNMRRLGKAYHYSYERLQREGVEPLDALADCLVMIEDMEARRELLIAHNGIRFDAEMLKAVFWNWLQINYEFDPELIYDTGAATKSSQLPDNFDPLPWSGETLADFSWRISNIKARGIRWALDGYCDEQHDLFKKAGLSKEQAHSAGVDSLLLHHLFQEHRKLAGCASQVDLTDTDSQAVSVFD